MRTERLNDSAVLLVLEQGETVLASMTQFCVDEGVTGAQLSGIGAVRDIVCGYYDLTAREYRFKEYQALCEVVSLTGNVAPREGKPFVHLHAVFSDTDNHTFGGHVSEMTVGVTLEVILTIFPHALHRQYDETTGLYLLQGR